MHIVVCVKQVPDTKIIKINPKTNTLDRRSAPAILNPYDAHAVQEAVKIIKTLGKGTISVLSMGPPQAVAVIKKSIEIGADRGFLISDRAFAGADTLATSYALSKALERISKDMPVDLILCGKHAIDGDTGQVGPGIARRLDIPPVTNVIEVAEVNEGEKTILIKRKITNGYELIKAQIPCLLTVEKEINSIEYSPMPNMIKAARYEPVIWSVNDLEGVDRTQLGLKGSPTIVGKMFTPPKPEGGKRLEGNADEQIQQLMELLNDKSELLQPNSNK
ncbi:MULTISPECIES: electron transfer flavoprotein subunit beta/FixA family protein [Bacillaceae]|uniref:Electron transfer flavoprotein small subunit n=1 Tax=Cytobacillus firmus TaxID=1399 RepID=A0AA46PKD9_CYTFI|nr:MULTISPECIES: electron transfer flavoprotein subunit beta/FixA family protein [Bacillaceae]KML46287.1 electron transfer flavoprotein subunit beta [Cytobacillus firmus]MCS0652062.1 electron transfer flavoprotein subunit beta/FixA family protein [Cytobacillus firmus]UYG96613.1 electron transfer flavoprotein subunit beta/FixA family protein [Cytobacillus firmus]WHY35678.1 electron transfer flavoprotein subunit beta/FixA family protein [Cytobacillus firmus]